MIYEDTIGEWSARQDLDLTSLPDSVRTWFACVVRLGDDLDASFGWRR